MNTLPGKLIVEPFMIVLLAVFCAIGASQIHPQKEYVINVLHKVPEVELSDLRKEPNILWIDARSEKLYHQAHIPGSLLCNEDHYQQHLENVLLTWEPEQKIVVYCASERCLTSHIIAKRLLEDGLVNIVVLKGGWKAWQESQTQP